MSRINNDADQNVEEFKNWSLTLSGIFLITAYSTTHMVIPKIPTNIPMTAAISQWPKIHFDFFPAQNSESNIMLRTQCFFQFVLLQIRKCVYNHSLLVAISLRSSPSLIRNADIGLLLSRDKLLLFISI